MQLPVAIAQGYTSVDDALMTAMTLVIDTNVCLDLFVFEDPRCGWLMRALEDGSMQALASDPMRVEWLRVLARPKLALSMSQQARAQARYDRCIRQREPSAERLEVRLPRCADADDQMFLEMAAEIGASVLLSRDRALLVLSRRSQRVAGFVVMTPEQFELHGRALTDCRLPVSG
jgi:predicted nucleic acid-binding protein